MRCRRPMALLLPAVVLAAGGVPALAQEVAPPQTFAWHDGAIPATTPWGQPVDTASTRQILSWTTAPEYTSPLVDHLPLSATVVSPTDHFGHPVGMPGVLHRTEEIHGYLRALGASSERVRFTELGETEEGNRLGLVQVGSAANLGRLDEIRRAYRRLADPRVSDRAEADRLVAELPVLYLLTAGLHSPETGPPEMVMELAYRLAASDDPVVREIRDSVVTLIVPVTEPDGRNRVVDWYRLHYPAPDTTKDRVPGPPYWGKYIFHDNNRDGLQLTARLTQEVVGLIRDWAIPFAHDLHESVPYLYTSTGTGPYNPVVDPITVAEWTWFANYEVTALTALGMPGVWTHGFYDGWNPTYLIWAANTRNGMGRFYETYGNAIPWTIERTVGSQTSVEWYRPNPPRDTTLWSLRNNTNYMQTGVLTALSLAARNRARLLRQYRTKAENALRLGRTSAPYAYIIPAAQERRRDAAEMVALLRRQGVEVHVATADGAFAADPAPSAAEAESGDSVAVAPGDLVIRMDQPYRSLVLTLMQVQDFPADAPRPYDDVAWTFPLMFAVEARAVTDPAALDHAMVPVTAAVAFEGSVTGAGPWWVVPPSASAFTLPARIALGRTRVQALEGPVVVAGDSIPAGAWLIRSRDLPAERARRWAAEFGLSAVGADDAAVGDAARHELDLPRVAVLHTWRSTQSEGWARYTLDAFGVPYTYIAETELRSLGDLRRRFDVILFPDQGGDAKAIFEGLDPAQGPLPYRRTRDHPSLGFPDETDDMTGGMRYEGLIALRDFVERGGTLITLRGASAVPAAFGLVRGVDVTATPTGLFVPGSLVRGRVERPGHPIAYGFGSDLALHHRFGPYLAVDDDREPTVVVRYGDGDIRLSGLAQGGSALAGEPAVLSVPAGDGHYVLFGFNPLNRHQTFMTYGLVWNAILNWNDLDAAQDP
ncbi:MAG TPA: M14 family zinc carboxypeptidase [Longimicrobiales bacterium]|nr:M14 family zinc carboxypeptidase [Longimicrobiales bacterium]